MTALVTKHLSLVAGASDGINKLRGLILVLAVRGKLVPQHCTDEHADRLRQRIAFEKARLIAEGKLKKQKPLPQVATNEYPIEMPSGWAVARLGELVKISTGKLDANAAVAGGAYPFFTCSQTPLRIDDYSYDTSAVLLAGNGDFNLKKYNGRFDAYQRTYVIEPVLWSIDYCFIMLSAEIDRITENNRGSAIPYLKLGDITNPIVHIPPLAEQHRIVAKVDELMSLCDRLEAEQADAEAAHAQIVQALLHSLTQAIDAADFRASWQRLSEHFHTLFTTEASIDALKQTVLQLAVIGKLVSQDSADENASELLRQIADEKALLIGEGKVKKQKVSGLMSTNVVSIDIPSGWAVAKIGDIVNISTGKLDANAAVAGGMYPFFTCSKTSSRIDAYSYETSAVLLAGNGDFNLKKYTGRFDAYQRTYVIEPVLWSVDYCFIAISAGIEKITENNRGSAIPYLKLGDITNPIILVPPLAEQNRIVAKVDELMALCDQLKIQLTEYRQQHAQLATVLVEQAVG